MAECLSKWTCEKCSFENEPSSRSCEICETSPEIDGPPDTEITDVPGFSTWRCKYCTFDNNVTIDQCEMCNSSKTGERKHDKENFLANETRIILIGRTGSGKSHTGNNILGKQLFDSRASCGSVTSRCKRGNNQRYGRNIQVVDTPGLFDTGMTNDMVTEEILKCVGISAPGPHAIILVVGINRFTEEEYETVRLLQKTFGTNLMKYLIVVFTRKDDLERDGRSLDDLLRNAPQSLQRILGNCQNRCVAFNNHADEAENEEQVLKLFNMIEEMVALNNGEYYTSEMFEKAEEAIVDRENEIIAENKETASKRIREVRRQLSEEYWDQMHTNMESKKRCERELQKIRKQRTELSCPEYWPKHLDKTEYGMENEQDSDSILHQKMEELEAKISTIHKQQKLIKQTTQATLRQREREIMDRLQQLSAAESVRDDVRREVESGNPSLLQRMFIKITEIGQKIADGFESVFKYISRKIKGR